MSNELWEKYDEISDLAYIMIQKSPDGYYIVDRDMPTKKIDGPFETNEAAAMSLIEGETKGTDEN